EAEAVDQRIENDPHWKVGIGRNGLIGFVASRKGAEVQIGERRHADTMGELAGIPGGLHQRVGIERRQLRDEGKSRLDLPDLAGRLAGRLDDTRDIGVVCYSGNVERFTVYIINM